MAKTKMPQVASTSSSESSPPSPPPKKQKTSLSQKSKPKKKTKSQGVVIKEPMITRARTKRASTPGTSIGKGKEVVRTPTPSQSSSDTPTFVGKSPPETKYDRKIAKVMASMLDEAYKSHEGKQGSSKSPKSPIKEGTGEKEEEVTIPPKGFNKGKLVETPKYKVDFSRKKVCKMFYIDLSILKEALKYDLSPYLNSYMPWLSIRLPYCTKIVRHFYSNLEYVDDPIRNEVEEEMTTQVRGQTILISPSRINNWLGIEDPPDGFIPDLESNQIFSVLRPCERVGPLIFNPSDMCDLHRVLWYIYSRCLVNKSNNFTHFIERDYRNMASIILKEERNLGEMIFNEIKRHRTSGTRTTPMPFPQLISLFLKKNKIWYLEPNEPIERLIPVGRNQVGKLGIELPLKKPMESTPKKKKPETPGSKLDDTQSSAPPGTPSTPSFIGSTVKNYMKEVLDGFHVDIANTNAELMTHMNTQMSKLVEYMVKHNESMLAQQQAQTSAIQEIGNLLRSLHEKVDTIIHSTAEPSTFKPIPTSEPPPTSVPPPESTPGNILFSMDDPSSSTQIHVTMDEPVQPQPSQPESQPSQPEPQPTPIPAASPAGTEPLSDPPLPHSPSHHSPTHSDTIMVASHHDDLQIPPLHLPDPQPSPTFSTHEDSQDTGSTPLEVSPVSAAQPSRSSSLSHD